MPRRKSIMTVIREAVQEVSAPSRASARFRSSIWVEEKGGLIALIGAIALVGVVRALGI
jgi:hypothetical protein